MAEKEFSDVLEKLIEQEGMHHFEGDRGVRHLETIAEAMGYRSGLSEMLADNSFLQPALYEALLNARDFEGNWSRSINEWLESTE